MVRPLEKLKNIAESLNIPYSTDKYIGPADTFAVYKMTDISGANFADNRAQAHIARVRFDYIQPINRSYQDKMFEIIDLFINAGFTEPSVVVVNDNDEETILQFTAEIKM